MTTASAAVVEASPLFPMHLLHEPWTVITDLVLAVEACVFGLLLLRISRHQGTTHWARMMLSLSLTTP